MPQFRKNIGTLSECNDIISMSYLFLNLSS